MYKICKKIHIGLLIYRNLCYNIRGCILYFNAVSHKILNILYIKGIIMKKYIMSFVCLAAVFCALGCDDEPGTSLPLDGSPVDSARQLLCEDSGGTFANGLCTCGSLVCAENVFCHKDGKGCAGVQAPITSEEMKKQLEEAGATVELK